MRSSVQAHTGGKNYHPRKNIFRKASEPTEQIQPGLQIGRFEEKQETGEHGPLKKSGAHKAVQSPIKQTPLRQIPGPEDEQHQGNKKVNQ